MDKYKQSNQTITLESFLRKRRVCKKEALTHTQMFPTRGSYFISDIDLPKLYDLYYQEIFENKGKISLTEKNREFTPIKIDLDFKYYGDDKELVRKYTQEDIKTFISLYFSIIEQEETRRTKIFFL